MNEAAKIKFHFNKASKSYDEHCQLQTRVGENLLQHIKPHLTSSARIIDLGCGTGIVTQRFAAEFPHQTFHAIDIANALLQKASERLAPANVQVYEADFNHLPVYEERFDLAVANMSLQWSADLSATFAALKNSMQEQGYFAFSIPLAGTLAELKYHFSLNHFQTLASVHEQLTQNGYEVLFSQQEKIPLRFANLLALLKSIKAVGANYVGKRLNKGLRGKAFLNVRTAQQLTYVIGYVVARKIPCAKFS